MAHVGTEKSIMFLDNQLTGCCSRLEAYSWQESTMDVYIGCWITVKSLNITAPQFKPHLQYSSHILSNTPPWNAKYQIPNLNRTQVYDQLYCSFNLPALILQISINSETSFAAFKFQ